MLYLGMVVTSDTECSTWDTMLYLGILGNTYTYLVVPSDAECCTWEYIIILDGNFCAVLGNTYSVGTPIKYTVGIPFTVWYTFVWQLICAK